MLLEPIAQPVHTMSFDSAVTGENSERAVTRQQRPPALLGDRKREGVRR